MNLQLSDERIRATCRELVTKHGSVSGRQLCEELRRRFGAVGKTLRVFRIWREECPTATSTATAAPKLPADMFLMQKRVEAAEALASEYLRRAELAEFRERAHQDHWAMEVDRLRQEVAVLSGKSKPFAV
jgi:Plasmid replication region DNA-binding N-term